MKINPKVVSFERSAAYVHHCAMKNRRDNHAVEALELMRHAVERSPDNAEYRLDLAEMYCEMGCHAQSMRILLNLLTGPEAPTECYYGLALNQLGRNELPSARRALNAYRRCSRDREFLDEAEDLRDEIDYYEDMKHPVDRRARLAERCARKACGALRAGDYESAIDLFEKSLREQENQNEMRALYAIALQLVGRNEDALGQAIRSVNGSVSLRTACSAAQVFAACGHEGDARELLNALPFDFGEENELQLLAVTMGELGMHEAAAERVRLALQEEPYSRLLLHLRATALHKSGKSDDRAAAFWQRIQRIDPDDTIAAFFLQAARNGTLSENEPDYVYEVPVGERKRRLQLLAEALEDGTEKTVERWREDREFRNLTLWAADSANEHCARSAALMLAVVDDPAAVDVCRELLLRSSVPTETKMRMIELMRLRGIDVAQILPGDIDVDEEILPDIETLLSVLPVGERQLVRLAADVLAMEYDVEAERSLAMIWHAYRKNVRDRNDALLYTEEAAGALAWIYFLQHDKKPNEKKLARLFGCEMRRMYFYARRIISVLKLRGGTRNEDR